ncbi:MAG: ATP-binding protein [Bdellovibrionota bacterium]
MYLKRKIDDFFLSWKKNEDKKPLIVRGARQVGKTESILHFAKKNYKNVVYINFVESPFYKNILSDGFAVKDIIKNISLINTEFRFEKNKTIIIFDELQEFPNIATSLKFFMLDKRFDVIASGSMLGLNYKSIESNSVGFKIDYEMHSLDFEEFLWAVGYEQENYIVLLEKMKKIIPLNEVELKVFSNLFLDFCVIGGMPAIVKEYVAKKTFEGILDMQRQLVRDYKEDIRKYALGIEQAKIINVFNQIPVQLSKENKKFQISKVAKGAKFKDYSGCIERLKDAGIVNVCYCLNYLEFPLKGNFDINKYKIYFADTGLLVASLDDETQENLRVNKNLHIYKGAFFENIIAESLVKQGYELYYYKRDNSTLENDFFVRTSKDLIPIEVKAKNNKAKSLTELITSERYPAIKYGIKFIDGNIGFSNNIWTFPYFCSFLLKRYLSSSPPS